MASVAYELFQESVYEERYGQLQYAMLPFIVKDVVTSYTTSAGVCGDAMQNPVIPTIGAQLDSVFFPNVRCFNRRPRVVSKNAQGFVVRIECEFQREYPEHGTVTTFFPLQGSSHLVQEEIIAAKKDGTKLQFKLPDGAGGLKNVDVSLNVTMPTGELVIPTTEFGNDPEAITALFQNKVNEHVWHDGQPKEWLCTGAEYEPIQTLDENCRWAFRWHFVCKKGGHIYKATWKDPNTGGTPADGDPPGSVYHITMDDYHDTAAFGVNFPDH